MNLDQKTAFEARPRPKRYHGVLKEVDGSAPITGNAATLAAVQPARVICTRGLTPKSSAMRLTLRPRLRAVG